MKILVTGGGGFVGMRLVRALRDLHPNSILLSPPPPGHLSGLDIADPEEVSNYIARELPDLVIHLAAVAAVKASFSNPRQAWEVNLGGTLNVILSMSEHCPRSSLIYVSSAEVYGRSFLDGGPINEAALLQPVNPYAASKAAADILARQASAGGLHCVILRPFNHTGPGQAEAFVVPSFAGQIARIEAGKAPPIIRVGSLDEERDFLDVDDVVDAYVLASSRCKEIETGTVFNVSSGTPTRIGDILEILLAASNTKIGVQVEATLLRRVSVPRVIGDSVLIRSVLGWNPSRSLAACFASVLEFKRSELL